MNHISQLADRLSGYGLDALLLTGEANEWYAVGFRGEGAVLIAPTQSWYFTDSRYIEAAGERVERAQVIQSSREKPVRAWVGELAASRGWRTVGFEERSMTVHAHEKWTQALPVEWKPASGLAGELRARKDAGEVEVMLRAQRLAERALEETLPLVRPGVTEKEIAARLEYNMLRLGAEKKSFDTIVASGPNGSRPHAVPGARKLRAGEFVTIDFGCVVEGYCSDTTRTLAVGEPTREMRRVYDTVLQAQLAGIAAARAGVTGRAVDAAAREVIERAGYGEYFGHSFGHSVGVEIHEAPHFAASNDKPMPAGAVVSAEPGIYLPGRFGVRIEDVVRLTPAGCEDLTRFPKELTIL